MHHQKLLCMLHSCHVSILACCVRESALLKNYSSYAAQFGYPLSTSLPTRNISIILSYPILSFSKNLIKPPYVMLFILFKLLIYSCYVFKCLLPRCKFICVRHGREIVGNVPRFVRPLRTFINDNY